VIEGLGEAHGETLAPLYQVVWGALDVAAHEAWQNPSTNAAIRLSILETAHQLARDAAASKDAPWSTVAHLQLRILHGDEAHVLSLTPFVDSESCTVTHLQFAQSVFDAHGPERGILNLAQDPAAIHAIPGGKALPLQAYVCVGAHRKARLSEAQLNYVHARGLLAHGFDTRHLPRPAQLRFDLPMPAAKSTRVSAAGLDVLASSYHVADQVYTTVSVVQYPPFGTQFEWKEEVPARLHAIPAAGTMQIAKRVQAPRHNKKPDMPLAYSRSVSLQEDDAYSTSHDGDSAGSTMELKRRPATDDRVLLYLERRIRDLRPVDKSSRKDEDWKEWFTEELQEGQYFFVDGVLGDPFDIRERIVLFDVDQDDPRFSLMEQKAKEISKLLYASHKQAWNPSMSFFGNILLNKKKAVAEDPRDKFFYERTAAEQYSALWMDVIRNEIEENQTEFVGDLKDDNFWYCAKLDKWKTILDGAEYQHTYADHTLRRVRQLKESGVIPQRLANQLGLFKHEGLSMQGDQIPLPAHLRRGQAQPPQQDLAGLQARVGALEAQLRRQRQDDNTSCLLERVLERLELAD
jgi:hypothetical protein